MTRMKKLASLLLAMVMALALAAPALAAGDYPDFTITVTPGEESAGHTYTMYQIFKGVPNGNNLNNIAWGDGVDVAKFVAALKTELPGNAAVQALGTGADVEAEDVAAAINNLQDGTPIANAASKALAAFKTPQLTGKEETPVSGEYEAGYYVIQDVKGDSTVYTVNRLVAALPISPKDAPPTVPKFEKKVKEFNTDSWGSVASYPNTAGPSGTDNVVDFRMEAPIPGTYIPTADGGEGVFGITIHDTQGDGLTLNEGSMVITLGSVTLSRGTDYNIVTGADRTHTECTFEIVIPDIRKFNPGKDDKLVVEYNSTLNEDAVIGGAGNTNKAYMTDTKGGESNKPETVVFTFKMDISKIDGETQERTLLPGAVFKLERQDGNDWVEIATITNGNVTDAENNVVDGEFTFGTLAKGFYRLEEVTAPTKADGTKYNSIGTKYFELDYTTTTDTSGVTTVTGVTGEEKQADGSPLDASMDRILNFTGTAGSGTITSDVANVTGFLFPNTGGIGTTIFYVLGGILVVGAAVLLITKRRMGASEE